LKTDLAYSGAVVVVANSKVVVLARGQAEGAEQINLRPGLPDGLFSN
jgi:hypothetical protein